VESTTAGVDQDQGSTPFHYRTYVLITVKRRLRLARLGPHPIAARLSINVEPVAVTQRFRRPPSH
jgi:hypothetical protein